MFIGAAVLANIIIPTLYVQWYLSMITLPAVIVIEALIPIFGSPQAKLWPRVVAASKANFLSAVLGAPFAALVFNITRGMVSSLDIPEADHISKFAQAALYQEGYGNLWPIYTCVIMAFLLSVVVESFIAARSLASIKRNSVRLWVLAGNAVSYLALVGFFLYVW